MFNKIYFYFIGIFFYFLFESLNNLIIDSRLFYFLVKLDDYLNLIADLLKCG